jgi:beta-phosphoglucomutase-like phosphatase (HAD superfamily)
LNAKVDLVIFDCDGVLVDSEVISCRAHSQMLTRHGYPITAAVFPVTLKRRSKRMRAPPERCLVIEDSIPGITGAVAAGMIVLGFHGGSHCRPGHGDTLRAAGATVTFDDMRQLPGLIGQIAAN